MRGFFASAAAVSAAVCLVSCSVPMKDDTTRRNGLREPFTANASITIEKLQAEGVLHREGGEWDIEFSSPNTLSGGKLAFCDGTVSASYKGLSFSVPQSAIPVKAMMSDLIKAVEDNSVKDELTGEEKDGCVRIKGSLEAGDYTLIVDENGNLSGFEMPGNKLTMSFTELTLSGSSPEKTSDTVTGSEAATTTASTTSA